MPLDNNDNLKVDETKVFSTDNIFDDIWWELDFWDDTTSFEAVEVKKTDYFNIWANVLSFLNFGIFIVIIISLFFFYVQVSATSTMSFLNPICRFFVWDVNLWWDCSGFSYYKDNYNKKMDQLKWDILSIQIPLLVAEFQSESIWNSKEVQFLLDKSRNKLVPLKILEDFDDIKNEFINKTRIEPSLEAVQWEKNSIVCKDIQITDSFRLSTECRFFAYDSSSMKLASEFQRDIENGGLFKVINKQDTFRVREAPEGDYSYTYMTSLKLDVQYIGENYLNY